MLIPPEMIEKIRRDRDEQRRFPQPELPLPSPDLIYPVSDDAHKEPEETTARVVIIEM